MDTSTLVTDSELAEALKGKQNVISDLDAIRSGAEKGATALQTHQDISGKADKVTIVNHGVSDTTYSIAPNILHVWDAVATLNLTLATSSNATLDEFMFQFTSGATATTLLLPDTIKWVVTPNIVANMIYQCSIINNVGVIAAANI